MKKNILLVEYNSEIIETVNQLLSNDMFDITTAGDQHIARLLLAKRPYDMVITALLLPKSHGYTLAQYITQTYPKTKIIVIGERMAGTNYQQEAAQYGVCEFIEKPINGSSFRKKVMSHLGIQTENLYANFDADSTNFMVLPPLDQLRPKATPQPPEPKEISPFDEIINDVQNDDDAYEIELEDL